MNQPALSAPLTRACWLSPVRQARLVAAAVLIPVLVVLGLAGWLRADPKGHGTHQQLGLAPCSLLLTTGLPCPTCGMTTAFAHAAKGQLLQAFLTQPAGAALALATAAAAIVSAYALVRGVSLAPLGAWLLRPRPMLGLAVVVLVAWVYKIILIVGFA